MTGEARTTERLILRAPGSGDAPAYRALLMHPTIGEWLRPAPLAPFEPDDGDLWLDDDIRHWERFGFGPWAVTERGGGEYLGRVGLRWSDIDGRAAIEVLWSTSPERHGEGIAAEAATAALALAGEMELDEVLAMILPINLASRRVAEKIGMERVGNVEHAGFDHLLYRFVPTAR
jgi:[ribosomal protein S5]-alanine N-acetyltransferase